MTRDKQPIGYIPSEILEPALQTWCGLFIQELGSFRRCPGDKWWNEWRLRAQGLSRFLVISNSTHSILAFGTAQSNLRLHGFLTCLNKNVEKTLRDDERARRRQAWKTARDIVERDTDR